MKLRWNLQLGLLIHHSLRCKMKVLPEHMAPPPFILAPQSAPLLTSKNLWVGAGATFTAALGSGVAPRVAPGVTRGLFARARVIIQRHGTQCMHFSMLVIRLAVQARSCPRSGAEWNSTRCCGTCCMAIRHRTLWTFPRANVSARVWPRISICRIQERNGKDTELL